MLLPRAAKEWIEGGGASRPLIAKLTLRMRRDLDDRSSAEVLAQGSIPNWVETAFLSLRRQHNVEAWEDNKFIVSLFAQGLLKPRLCCLQKILGRYWAALKRWLTAVATRFGTQYKLTTDIIPRCIHMHIFIYIYIYIMFCIYRCSYIYISIYTSGPRVPEPARAPHAGGRCARLVHRPQTPRSKLFCSGSPKIV